MNAKDVMIPISDCAQVAEDHSLQAAMIMLSAYRQRLSKNLISAPLCAGA